MSRSTQRLPDSLLDKVYKWAHIRTRRSATHNRSGELQLRPHQAQWHILLHLNLQQLRLKQRSSRLGLRHCPQLHRQRLGSRKGRLPQGAGGRGALETGHYTFLINPATVDYGFAQGGDISTSITTRALRRSTPTPPRQERARVLPPRQQMRPHSLGSMSMSSR